MKIRTYALQTTVLVYEEEIDEGTLLDLEAEGKKFDPVAYVEGIDAGEYQPDPRSLGSWQLGNILIINNDGTELNVDHIDAGEVPIKNGELVL